MTSFGTEESIGPLINSTENFLDQFKGLHEKPERKKHTMNLNELSIEFEFDPENVKTACRE